MSESRVDQNAPYIEGKRVKKWLTVCLAEDDSFHIIGDTGTAAWSLILARHMLDQIAMSITQQRESAVLRPAPGMFTGRPPRTS